MNSKKDKGIPNPEDPNELLDKLLKEGYEKGEQLANKGRELTETGQQIMDLANAALNINKHISINPNIESLITDWDASNNALGLLLNQITVLDTPSVNSTSGTVTISTVNAYEPKVLLPLIPYEAREDVQHSINNLNLIVTRSADINKVISLMTELGLNKAARGKKSPLEAFLLAHETHSKPSTSDNDAITSLIPIRESIRGVIDSLLKKRPLQETAKNERAKLISIGTQLKRDMITEQTVESWCDQWELLIDNLSSAKEALISREEWRKLLNQATLFLINLLSGLDPEKVNRKKRKAG